MFRTDVRRCLGPAALLCALAIFGGCASQDAPSRSVTRSDAKTPRAAATVETDGQYDFVVSEVVRIDSDVRNDYQRAVALLEQEQLDEGIELLESVIERAPEVTIPHIDLGVAYGRAGDEEKAEASLEAALSLAPNHPVALNELGILQRRTGRFEAARASYERLLAIHPGFHYALLNLGVLCDLYLEDLPCALENYQRYEAIVSDDAEVGIWIADIRNRLADVN